MGVLVQYQMQPQLTFPSTTDLTSPLSQNATSHTGAAEAGFQPVRKCWVPPTPV